MPTTSFLTGLIIPLNLCLTLVAIGVVIAFFRWRKTGVTFIIVGAAWLFAWTLPITSLWIGGYLEHMYPHPIPSALPTADVIVVLGGNTANARDNWFEPYDRHNSTTRVDTAAELYLAHRAPKVLLSGGALEGDVSEARGMAHAIRQLGVPEDALILENSSRSTYENAARTKELLNSRDLHQVLLVTSALHMPRAVATFHKQQVEVTAASVPPQIMLPPDGSVSPWLPNARALEASRSIIKEYAAFVLYRVRGWV
jgi:uncharacterized SAM-binding protein YcdF (DUF218 family)